jgi:hypothetical protein
MTRWAAETPDDHYINPIVAYRIRQEFGVEGQKPGRKSREWRRKAESWPVEETPKAGER